MRVYKREKTVSVTFTNEEYFCLSWLMDKIKITDLDSVIHADIKDDYQKVTVDTITRKQLQDMKKELEEFNNVF